MTRRPVSTFLVIVIVAAGGCMPSAAAEASQARTLDGKVSDWRGVPTRLGGTWQYSRGEFVYQDHIYDDLGAETRQRSQQHGSTGAPAGDYRYPTNEKRYGNNAADLLELRVASDRKAVWVLARLNTLKVRDSTVVALGFDIDRRRATGGGDWPHAAGINVPGVDRVLTMWGTNGSVAKLPSGRLESFDDVAVSTANADNAIEARVPRTFLGRGSKVRVVAATGLWDAENREWLAAQPGSPSDASPGGGNPAVATRAFNVAFRGDETGSYMEEHQAQALAAGDIARFYADVDLAAASGDETRPYRIRRERFYVAIVEEKFTIPPHHEGLSYDGVAGRFQGLGGAALSQTFDFYGRHQPYGLYVPSTYGKAGRIPAALVLHGHGGSHSTYNSQPGFLADMGEARGSPGLPPMFLITPLARGSSFYADWGEADTLAVLRDVLSRFPIDRDRVYLTGYSMGGYGVYRLASLYPDRFAAAGVWAGYTGEFTGAYLTDPRWIAGDPAGLYDSVGGPARAALAPLGVGGGRAGKAVIGDPVDTLENLRHLPVVHLAGSNDQIVPTSGQYAAPRRLMELGYRIRFDLYPGYEHLTFAIVDDWRSVRTWLGDRKRETSPREITYKFSDGWTDRGLATKLSLVHGNAWWLRDLTMRKVTDDALTLASADATSRAIHDRSIDVVNEATVFDRPTPHVRQGVRWTARGPRPTANRADLRMTGVGRAAIDLTAAHLSPCGLVVSVRSDGPTTVRLLGRFPADATVAGARTRRVPTGIDITIGKGTKAFTVRCE